MEIRAATVGDASRLRKSSLVRRALLNAWWGWNSRPIFSVHSDAGNPIGGADKNLRVFAKRHHNACMARALGLMHDNAGSLLEIPELGLFQVVVNAVFSRGDVMAARKYSKAASKKVGKTMHERKKGTLRSGSGKKVKSKKQAIAIGLSQARRAGKKVPKKKK